MCRFKIALLACLAPASAFAAPETYVLDPVHSFAHFAVSHMGMSTIRGRFDKTSGKIMLDLAGKTGSLDVKIETASLNTGDAKHEPGSWAAQNAGPRSRDEHLRSADFFNIAEFPAMTYKSVKFNFNGDKLESVDGNLTLLGVTKPVKLIVTAFKCAQNPMSRKDQCGADAQATVKRSEFGMKTFLGPIPDEVQITLDVESQKE